MCVTEGKTVCVRAPDVCEIKGERMRVQGERREIEREKDKEKERQRYRENRRDTEI